MKTTLLALAAAAAVAAPALAFSPEARPASVSSGEEVRIPFANFRGGVRGFDAPSDDVVYLQDRSRNWYRAQMLGPCFGLRWAFRIGIDTRGSSSFDRFSRLVVEGDRCPIESLTRSDGPPKKAKKALKES